MPRRAPTKPKGKPNRKTKTAGLGAAPPLDGEVIPPRPARGSPYHHPEFTDEQRKLVCDLATWGLPLDMIAQHVIHPKSGQPINRKTLMAHFAPEIDAGKLKGNAQLARVAFQQAVGRPAEYDESGNVLREELKPVPALTIWMTKVRLGYREAIDLNVQSVDNSVAEALGALSYEDRERIRAILRKGLPRPSDAADS